MEDAAVENELKNSAGQSAESEQPSEENQPELKVSDTGTLMEAGQDGTKSEAQDKVSTSEAQSG